MLKTFEYLVTGLPVKAGYYTEDIEEIFIPFLKKLTELQKKKGTRIIAYFAAPPGLGKSTLVTFLEELSKQTEGVKPIQSIGMDGFHYFAEYLKSHTVIRDGQEILLDKIKGSPESFDVDRLGEFLRRLQTEKVVSFPAYDRSLHDVVNDAYVVDGDIVLMEGNYLLLEDERWKPLRQFADYTAFAYTDIEVLKPRLIARKLNKGITYEEAESFFEYSDGRNARLVLSKIPEADLCLECIEGRWIRR